LTIYPYRAIKTNIADSLDVLIQMERRPGMRIVSEVLALRSFDLESDKYDFELVYRRSSELPDRQLASAGK